MRNFLIAIAATFLLTPPACLFTPSAIAKTDQEVSRTSQPVAEHHGKKPLTNNVKRPGIVFLHPRFLWPKGGAFILKKQELLW